MSFQLHTEPKAQVACYHDYLDNPVHHFNIPGVHDTLNIVAESTVALQARDKLVDAVDVSTWRALEYQRDEFLDWLVPSEFARPSDAVNQFRDSLGITQKEDPLTLLRRLNTCMYERFEYRPQSTRVDSPIEKALEQRAGVCQDFSHLMIAIARGFGIPCRYVSGYLFHRHDLNDRSAEDATHAWVEAWLPGLGWIGFDPTNDRLESEHHIRVAVGRDYSDVPPNRGVYKGSAEEILSVGVSVFTIPAPLPEPPVYCRRNIRSEQQESSGSSIQPQQ